jgi:hypothetical protein
MQTRLDDIAQVASTAAASAAAATAATTAAAAAGSCAPEGAKNTDTDMACMSEQISQLQGALTEVAELARGAIEATQVERRGAAAAAAAAAALAAEQAQAPQNSNGDAEALFDAHWNDANTSAIDVGL